MLVTLLASFPLAKVHAQDNATEFTLIGYALNTNSDSEETQTSVAVFDISLDFEDEVIEFAYSFIGAADANELRVQFTTAGVTEELPQLSELTETGEDRLATLLLDSATVAGKTGQLSFTLNNKALEAGVTSQLFLVDIAESSAAAPEAFAPPPPIELKPSGGRSGGGADSLLILFCIILIFLRLAWPKSYTESRRF